MTRSFRDACGGFSQGRGLSEGNLHLCIRSVACSGTEFQRSPRFCLLLEEQLIAHGVTQLRHKSASSASELP